MFIYIYIWRLRSVFLILDSLRAAVPSSHSHHIFTKLYPFLSKLPFCVVQMKQTPLYFLIKYYQKAPTCKYKTISFLDHTIENGDHSLWSSIFTVFLTKNKHINWLFFSTETCDSYCIFALKSQIMLFLKCYLERI